MTDEAPRGDQERKRGNRAPETEIVIGARIKALRVGAGISQSAFAVALSVSSQQVQKYEKGKTRVAASTLQSIAEFLGVQPGYFFNDTSAQNGDVAKIIAALEAADDFQHVTDPKIRKRLGSLLRTLADKIDP